jgi:hypothetical protein
MKPIYVAEIHLLSRNKYYAFESVKVFESRKEAKNFMKENFSHVISVIRVIYVNKSEK